MNSSGRSRDATLIAPTLLDFASTSVNVRLPYGRRSSLKRCFATTIEPFSHQMTSFGCTRPASRAAAAVTTLKVEPGS